MQKSIKLYSLITNVYIHWYFWKICLRPSSLLTFKIWPLGQKRLKTPALVHIGLYSRTWPDVVTSPSDHHVMSADLTQIVIQEAPAIRVAQRGACDMVVNTFRSSQTHQGYQPHWHHGIAMSETSSCTQILSETLAPTVPLDKKRIFTNNNLARVVDKDLNY